MNLESSRYEEVLLLEAELLAGLVVVVGVEDLYNVTMRTVSRCKTDHLGHVGGGKHLGNLEGTLAGLEGIVVVAIVELGQVEIVGRHRGPQAQRVGVESVVAGYRYVIGHGHHLVRTVEGDGVGDVEPLDLKRAKWTRCQPSAIFRLARAHSMRGQLRALRPTAD